MINFNSLTLLHQKVSFVGTDLHRVQAFPGQHCTHAGEAGAALLWGGAGAGASEYGVKSKRMSTERAAPPHTLGEAVGGWPQSLSIGVSVLPSTPFPKLLRDENSLTTQCETENPTGMGTAVPGTA